MKRLVLTLVLTAQAASAQVSMDEANACFEAQGGPDGCPTLFGWCSPTWGAERRAVCGQALADAWDAALNDQWGRLKALVAAQTADLGSPVRERSGDSALWDRLVAEQRGWIAWRDLHCGWGLPVYEGESLSADEQRAACLLDTTQRRVQQIYDYQTHLILWRPL